MNEDVLKFRKWIETIEKDKYTTNQYRRSPSRSQYLRERYPFDASHLIHLYTEGFGLKSIANLYGVTYTKLRVAFTILGIDIRKGRNVVTDKLKEIRSYNATTNPNNPFKDWTVKRPHLSKNNSRGIQGLYNGIWLRSTYEYIFAKWLDRTNQVWRYEETQISTPFGGYRPDFFIYKDETLVLIVEIKGLWFNTSEDRLKKTKFIQDSMFVPVSIITDVTPFIEFGSNYSKEKQQWKALSNQSKL